jgi:hypothetical protein
MHKYVLLAVVAIILPVLKFFNFINVSWWIAAIPAFSWIALMILVLYALKKWSNGGS